ncbi:hypothetical protein HanRHA438_Chr14g0649521 [Helianthus annuus]|nr:hypothetical protein HanRHA438_Chr14g0649521 [Helianthus annuus]
MWLPSPFNIPEIRPPVTVTPETRIKKRAIFIVLSGRVGKKVGCYEVAENNGGD